MFYGRRWSQCFWQGDSKLKYTKRTHWTRIEAKGKLTLYNENAQQYSKLVWEGNVKPKIAKCTHISTGPQDIVHKWKRFLDREGSTLLWFTNFTEYYALFFRCLCICLTASYSRDIDTLSKSFVCAKHFDLDDIVILPFVILMVHHSNNSGLIETKNNANYKCRSV